jgi:hypothetical protein
MDQAALYRAGNDGPIDLHQESGECDTISPHSVNRLRKNGVPEHPVA